MCNLFQPAANLQTMQAVQQQTYISNKNLQQTSCTRTNVYQL